MCTKYGISALTVYDQFDKDMPMSISQVFKNLGDDVFSLVLGGGDTLSEFILSSASDGYLESLSDGKYVLTNKGFNVREHLRNYIKENPLR